MNFYLKVTQTKKPKIEANTLQPQKLLPRDSPNYQFLYNLVNIDF